LFDTPPERWLDSRFNVKARSFLILTHALAVFAGSLSLFGTPANKAALSRHYDRFLVPALNKCFTCHLPSTNTAPETLEEFPHNPFGARLRAVRKELLADDKPADLAARLKIVAEEDSDGDGFSNQGELLLGKNPGDPKDTPGPSDKERLASAAKAFAEFESSYRWQPFSKVPKPSVPAVAGDWARNPIDQFIAAEHQKRDLKPRPPAPDRILLRRVSLDLIGLNPTPEEIARFESDQTGFAYENAVDRLLEDPRYGERWARHWMDIWRYSDWAGWSGGNQIRDSKPHIWRWRDWIVESLNGDKGYDQMLLEMLAADEAYPEDADKLRATGFLVRNYKMLSREQWLEDTVKHTSQAFMGVTIGCAKCHDHMFDSISQNEYYQMRAIFEPHQVRTDRIPGDLDSNKDGLARAYDKDLQVPTYFFVRGDERHPDTNRVMKAGVPALFGGAFSARAVSLPWSSANPDQRPFVMEDLRKERRKEVEAAQEKWNQVAANEKANHWDKDEAKLRLELAQARQDDMEGQLEAEHWEIQGSKWTEGWTKGALRANSGQRKSARAEAALARLSADKELENVRAKLSKAREANDSKGAEGLEKKQNEFAKKLEEAVKNLNEAEEKLAAAGSTDFKPRSMDNYPKESSGRRLGFAKWLIAPENPLTARVAVNHIWARHFGRGIVPSTADFGANGKPASHPELLDWLAQELIDQGWSMKKIHRLIVTSSLYRMASTGSEENAAIDPDNIYLWRMPSRRMEAELVRDNLLFIPGELDSAFGGPDIDNNLGLVSKRRSLYLRQAAEKEVEFLKIFDGPSVTECYIRHPTVVPQQALALANNELTSREARALAKKLEIGCGNDDRAFVQSAFERILTRKPTAEELSVCVSFLEGRQQDPSQKQLEKKRENLLLTLFNHNDFVTIR
jgi:hypothetical protein